MNLIQLQYFSVVARLEHMTRAAEELHISQPTLSLVISRLENELGTPLFERRGRKLILNDKGHYLLERTEYILSYLDETVDAFKKASEKEVQSLSLCMHTGHIIFQKILQQFTDQHPMLNLIMSESDEFQPDMINICYDKEDLTQNTFILQDDEILLFVNKKSKIGENGEISVASLKNEDFIEDNHGFLSSITTPFCKRAGFKPHFKYKADSDEQVTSLIESGYGITFWPESVRSQIESAGIRAVHLKKPLCYRSISLSLPIGRGLTSIEKDFVEFCQGYFSHSS